MIVNTRLEDALDERFGKNRDALRGTEWEHWIRWAWEDDPEPGPRCSLERLCRKCGEEWPRDGGFWYFDAKGQVMGHCKACWSERRRAAA